MKKKTLLTGLCALAFGGLSISCSDNADDPKYRSLPPMFSDMELKTLNGGDTTLRAGEEIIATALQSKKGRLLNGTDYNWTATPAGTTHRFRKSVIYDKESFNPTDTLIFETPGVYQLTFKGKYRTSGQSQVVSDIVDIKHGKITYQTPTFQYYNVIIEKRIVVK